MDDAFDAYVDAFKDTSVFCSGMIPNSIPGLFIP
jgi:hypothetical protein